MFYIKHFILTHSDWKDLLSKDPYNLTIKEDGNYLLFKYNQLGSNFNDPLVREARGIIYRKDTLECVCHPFNKFGNYGESYCPAIDWNSAEVQQKIDGSLMKVWFDDNKWHVSTNGTIDAFKANLNDLSINKTYGDIFLNALATANLTFKDFIAHLTENFVYLFELVSPITKVVIPYNSTELYYLGCRDRSTDKEIRPSEYNPFLGLFKTPIIYSLRTLSDVEEAAKALPWDEEGYVVCDKDYNRVKIKSPEYIKAHHSGLNGNITKERLLDLILENEQTELLIYYPEYSRKIDDLKNKMNNFKHYINILVDTINPDSYSDRKAFAEKVKEYPAIIQPFLFMYKKLNIAFNRLTRDRWLQIFETLGYDWDRDIWQ